jgi:hypothetical protein
VAYILRSLPFFSTRSSVVVQGREVPITADQIILWVSLTEGGKASLDRDSPRFPAILDTGHTHNFSIREEQLVEWSGLDPRVLTRLAEIRIGGDRLPLLEVDVWLHSNVAGKREVAADPAACCLELDAGIAVYPGPWLRRRGCPCSAFGRCASPVFACGSTSRDSR